MTGTAWLVVAIAIAPLAVWGSLQILQTLQMLQQENYSNRRLVRWLFSDVRRFARVSVQKAKKPLVYTGRAIRILLTAGALLALELVALFIVFIYPNTSPFPFLILLVALAALSPVLVPAANWLLSPVQRAINARYLHAASSKLAEVKPIVVGITGSYGKTSTKHFLQTMLSSRYPALMTPGSYNTMMGVCRIINEQLQPVHQVFIVEMGAYGRGEIREIADLVQPSIGILTAIGPQHLEWFRTIENVAATKYELIQALPADGVAVFNGDDPRCRELADRTTHAKVLRFGIAGPGRFRLRAEEITHGPQGLSFVLLDDSGTRVPVTTRLLGRHNVLNILGAAVVALELGSSLDELAVAIARLEAPEHRLQLLNGAGGVTVIDDAYNSNPEGAAQALDVLRQFTTGRKILVTPGMVELGPLQEEANKAFGRQAAATCDYVVLVGPAQTRPIRAGLEEAAFPSDWVTTVSTLQEATAMLQRILKPGDVVLFENDLPDLYAES